MNAIESTIEAADRLEAEGRAIDAIDLLMEANRQQRSKLIEERLVQLRHDGFFQYTPHTEITEWPPHATDLFPDVPGIPEISPDELTVDALRSGILCHGALVVKRLFDDEQIEVLRRSIRRTIKAFDAFRTGTPVEETTPWYRPLRTHESLPTMSLANRAWVRDSGGCLAAESPRAMFNLIDITTRSGVTDVIAGYLGERPALSVLKTTLRTVAPMKTPNGWHQDGAFLGDGIRTVNMWVSLSHCGVDAPSIDIVPKRLHEIAPTGTEGAEFDWSVSRSVVDRVAGEHGIHHGIYEPGDVVFFDEMNLHCTSATEEMTQKRLAIEAWFFAPSSYPLKQYPVLV